MGPAPQPAPEPDRDCEQSPPEQELRAEHRRLLHSFEYAYAMGARRTMGERDPRLEWVVERIAQLEREIAALRGSAADPPPGAAD